VRPSVHRRTSSPVSLVLTLALLVVVIGLGLAGLNREAIGEPVIPDQITSLFTRSDPALPAGLNYDLSVLDPNTQAPMGQLPQLGTVEVRLAITNDSALPLTFKFKTSMQCEFIVRHLYKFLGEFIIPLEVWRSSYFHNFAKSPTTLVLKPGDTKIYTAYWTINNLNESQVPPGDYGVYTSFRGVKRIEIDKPL